MNVSSLWYFARRSVRGRGRFVFGTMLGCCAACANDPAPVTDAPVDDAGRPIAISDAPPRRIVSLSPAISEFMFTLGAGDRLVGRTRWAEYPPAVFDVPDIGEGMNPNVEVVAARRPDLVVLYASPANSAAIERFERLRIATVSLRLDSLGSVAHAARLLGTVIGVSERANRLAADFEARLDSARAVPRSEPHVRVVIVSWDNPPIVIGGGSFLSEILDLSGAVNVFADIDEPSATVTIETIVDRDPDAVLVIGDDLPDYATRPEWRTVRAVRERRFVFVQGTDLSWPSFRAFEAVERVRRALAEIR